MELPWLGVDSVMLGLRSAVPRPLVEPHWPGADSAVLEIDSRGLGEDSAELRVQMEPPWLGADSVVLGLGSAVLRALVGPL